MRWIAFEVSSGRILDTAVLTAGTVFQFRATTRRSLTEIKPTSFKGLFLDSEY